MRQKAGFKVPPGGFRGGFPGKVGGQQPEIQWRLYIMNNLPPTPQGGLYKYDNELEMNELVKE